MEIGYLKEFVTLAEWGSYHDAADQLYISQSSLSKHIHALEKEWNCVLFERTSWGSVLTAQGRKALVYANRIIQADERCRSEFMQNTDKEAEVIYVASEYRTLTRFLAGFIRKYADQYTVNVQMGDSRFAKEALRRNAVELGIAKAFHADDSDLFYIPFGVEQLHVLLPTDHPLAGRESVHLQELAGEKFIFPYRDSSHTRNCIRACEQAGFNPHRAAYVDGEYSIVALVVERLGVSLLYLDPSRFSEVNNLAMVPVVPKNTVSGAICYRKDTELSKGARLFLEYAREKPYAV